MNGDLKQWIFDVLIDCGLASCTAAGGFLSAGDGIDTLKRPGIWIAVIGANFSVIKASRRSLPKRLEARVEAAAIVKADEKVQTMIGNLQIPPDPRG